jgi:hypothetical protein
MRQLVDFKGMDYGTGYPTDIDGFLEIKGRVFIFVEMKFHGTDLSIGQRLAYEHLVDNINKPSIAIIAEHYIADPEEDIIMAKGIVTEYRYEKTWYKFSDKVLTVEKVIAGFLKRHKLDKYIPKEI